MQTKKIAGNLIDHQGKTSKAVQNLEKLGEAVAKLQRLEEWRRKQQLSRLKKLEKLTEKFSC